MASGTPDARPDAVAVRAYLAAVYPAARGLIERLSPRQLARRFDSLDYYYSSASAESLRPPFTLRPGEVAQLPYLPAGAYYRASGNAPMDAGRFNAVLWSAFDRHTFPVHVLRAALPGSQVANFHSSFGARLGPQPSWTSPLAIVRYSQSPNGLEVVLHTNGSLRKATLRSRTPRP